MAVATEVYTRLHTLQCWVCGVPFAIPEHLHERMEERGTKVFCPNGHQIYYAETENEKLRKQLERERRVSQARRERANYEKERADHQQRRAVSLKGVVTRTKKRIAAGKCPCCHDQFQNLERHMRLKHPGYGEES